MSVQEMIDNALAKKEKRIRSGKFSPSSLGKCFRAQYWNRKDEPISNPIDSRTKRVFLAGDIFHQFVQEIVLSVDDTAQKEVLIETENFKGYADLVLKDEVIDIKSQHSRAFHYRQGLTWKELEPKLLPNILQVCFYAVYLNKIKARLVFISKDDLCIQEYPLEVETYALRLAEEKNTLKDFWQQNILPPAKPRAYPNKDGFAECGYCGWKDLCEKTEGVTQQKEASSGSIKG